MRVALVLILAGSGPPLAAANGESPAKPAAAMVQSLLARRSGFGAGATGGAAGAMEVVTSEADSGPGSLRAMVEKNKAPVWVTFAHDMEIPLQSLIRVGSDVTIDGRGHKVTLLYNGLAIYGSRNVIVTNIAVDGRFTGISQAINIADGSHVVWIDHLDLSRFNDRLVNVKSGSSDVTISWVKFHDHNKVMLLNNITSKNLFANFDRDVGLRVTIDHSWFVNTVQRNPRAQFGTFHIYNNLLENWDFYGMSFSLEARALIEGNIFANQPNRPCSEPPSFITVEGVERNYCALIPTAGSRAQLANGASDVKGFLSTKDEFDYGPDHTVAAFLRVRDNLYLGSAVPNLTDNLPEKVPSPPYSYAYEKPSQALANRIRAQAGNTL